MGYLTKFGKNYKTLEEFESRAQRFKLKELYINEWNSTPGKTHFLGHNKMSDWTDEEYKKLLTYKPRKEYLGKSSKVSKLNQVEPIMLNDLTLDKEVNWIDRGAVNAVKN